MRGSREDQAVSNVLGAILVTALLFVALIKIQTAFVPVWQENGEAEHAETVLGQFSAFKSEADRQLNLGINVPSSVPFTLERSGGFRFFTGGAGPGARLLMEPGGANTSVSSPELRITNSTQADLPAAQEEWRQIQGDTIENVTSIVSLRLRLDAAAKDHKGEWAYLQVRDRSGLDAGRFEAKLTGMSVNAQSQVNKAEFFLRSINAAGTPIYEAGIVIDNQQSGPDFPLYAWLNALDPNHRFDQILAAADGPFDVELTTTGGMPAMFASSYFQATGAGGSVLVGGGQQTFVNYLATTQSNRLTYQGSASRYVEQTIVYEHGAVLVAQPDGAVIAIPPALQVSFSSSLVAIDLTLPTLQPAPQVAPSSATTVATLVGSQQHYMLSTGPSLTFGLGTRYGDAWTTFWRSSFQSAGLSESLGHFSVASTSQAAWFTVHGQSSGPSHDIAFVLHRGSVAVSV